MKNTNFIFFIFFHFLFFSCKNNVSQEKKGGVEAKSGFMLPAEFDDQKGIFIAFPNVNHVATMKNSEVTAEIIRTLLPFTDVNFLVPNDSALAIFKPMLHDSIWKNPRLKVIVQPYQEFWMRDMGPVFLKNSEGKTAMLDYNFNSWGYLDTLETKLDESLDERLAAFEKIPLVSSSLVHEGGDTEVNGKGTLIVVETVEKQRNPALSLVQMEDIFKKTMGVKKVIWLKQGVYEDDHTFKSPIPINAKEKAYTLLTTGGHIDEFCRFVNPNTVLLAEVDSADLNDPIAIENQKRLAVNFEILKNATDQDGNPLKIIRMPMPKTMVRDFSPKDWVYQQLETMKYENGHVFPKGKKVKGILASSYLNFLIANKVVIAQKYYKNGMDLTHKKRDEASKKILESVFPNRKIIQIDAVPINWGGGGVHCITANQF
jgi:agmatine deiminase